LSLRLLVDECLLNKLLVDALIAAGHDVQTVNQAGLVSRSDDAVFAHAIAENRVFITSNCGDFTELAQARITANAHHPGVLLVFQYNNPNKDMSVPELIQAIANFEATGAPIEDNTVSLALYRY
jgi:predicted nuclease of predicted toxin-antitoxin system